MIVATVLAAPVYAAVAPPNDEPAGAIALPSVLPQSFTQATAGATSSGVDEICGSPSQSVWYSFTPPDDGAIAIGGGQDTLMQLRVFEEVVDADHLSYCAVGPPFDGGMFGQTRYYLAFGAGGGVISVRLSRDPRTLTIAIDPPAELGADGSVTIRGMVECAAPEGVGSLDATATQPVSRPRATGVTGINCALGPSAWSIDLRPDGARALRVGPMRVTVSGRYCGITACTVRRVSQTVRIHPGRGAAAPCRRTGSPSAVRRDVVQPPANAVLRGEPAGRRHGGPRDRGNGSWSVVLD